MTLSLFPFTDSSATEKSTGRGKSAALWEGVPYTAAQRDPRHGFYTEEDFEKLGLTGDDFTTTALNGSASASFAKLDQAFGVYSLTCDSSGGDHDGVQVQMPAAGSFDPTSANVICVEFTINLFQCSTFFVGLSATTTTIFDAASALPTDVDHIGFYRIDGGVVTFVVHNEEGSDVDDSAQILAADYYHLLAAGESEPTKLGFKFNDSKVFQITVDGVPYNADALSLGNTAMPEAVMTPSIAIARGATQDEATLRLDIDKFEGFSN